MIGSWPSCVLQCLFFFKLFNAWYTYWNKLIENRKYIISHLVKLAKEQSWRQKAHFVKLYVFIKLFTLNWTNDEKRNCKCFVDNVLWTKCTAWHAIADIADMTKDWQTLKNVRSMKTLKKLKPPKANHSQFKMNDIIWRKQGYWFRFSNWLNLGPKNFSRTH